MTNCISAPVAGGAISSRQFVDLYSTMKMNAETWVTGGCSYEYKYKKSDKYVHGWNEPCGYVIQTLPGQPNQ